MLCSYIITKNYVINSYYKYCVALLPNNLLSACDENEHTLRAQCSDSILSDIIQAWNEQ